MGLRCQMDPKIDHNKVVDKDQGAITTEQPDGGDSSYGR